MQTKQAPLENALRRMRIGYVFFDATNEELLDGDIWHPKMPMVPATIGLKIVMRPTTPWELLNSIVDFGLE